MLVQLPVCRLEELCAEIPAKLAPVHKLLKFGVRGSAELFFRFAKRFRFANLFLVWKLGFLMILKRDLQLCCAKVHFQPFLSSSVAEPVKENWCTKKFRSIYMAIAVWRLSVWFDLSSSKSCPSISLCWMLVYLSFYLSR